MPGHFRHSSRNRAFFPIRFLKGSRWPDGAEAIDATRAPLLPRRLAVARVCPIRWPIVSLIARPILACLLALALASPVLGQTNASPILQQQAGAMNDPAGASAQFGAASAISADGNTAAVGARSQDNGAGGIFIYVRNTTTGVWTQQGSELVGSGAAGSNSQQGYSIAISADGNTVIEGAPFDGASGKMEGAFWVFTRSAGVWTQQGGKMVGTGGNPPGESQGQSVVLSADGNTALVGGNASAGASGALGRVWLYTRSAGTWTQTDTTTASDASGSSQFGSAVSLSADGATALIGGQGDSSNIGAAWIYSIHAGALTELIKLVGTGSVGSTVNQGGSVALSKDGNTAVVGASADNAGLGAVWVFTKSGGTWGQAAKLVPSDGIAPTLFGNSVAVSWDGSVIVIGGPGDAANDGALWMFARTGATSWTQQGSKLQASDAAVASEFGSSAGLSADGNIAIVGGEGQNSNSGAIWAFDTNAPFPATALGSSVTQTVLVNMENTFTLGSISVVTQGAPNLDFTAASSRPSIGACQANEVFSAGASSCSIAIQLAPAAAGLRLGAIRFYDLSNTLQATVFLNGIGLAPLVTFSTAVINTVAGTGQTPGYMGDGGAATSAQLNHPAGLVFDGLQNYYIADSANDAVRAVNSAGSPATLYAVTVPVGSIDTVAGTGAPGFSGDTGPATSAEIDAPRGAAIDGAGNLYFADSQNNRVRKVDPVTGFITTFAGGGDGPDGGLATNASLNAPSSIAAGRAGDVYIADSGDNAIRRVSAASGVITTIAGTGTATFSGDGGSAGLATLNSPQAVAVDANENVYIADTQNNAVREVSYLFDTIATVAGRGGAGCGYSGDGAAATSANLCSPSGLALDAAGDFYFTDSSENIVRAVSSNTGIITTVAGSTTGTSGFGGDGGQALAAFLSHPAFPAIDNSSNLWITDNGSDVVREITGAAALAFGDLVESGPDSTSTPQDVTVTNTGSATLSFSNVQAGTNFLLNGDTTCTPTTTLTPGQSCVVGVEFSPATDTGALTGVVTIVDNAVVDSNGTQTISLSGTGLNPVPVVTTIAPMSAIAGGSAFTLTVTGNRFVSTSVVNWNGSSLPTTFVSATSLTARVPASDIALAGTATVSVTNLAPGGGIASGQTFTINNPLPALSFISPAALLAGASTFALTIIGKNFVAGSVVYWNGAPLATTFIGATRITGAVPASDLTVAGTAAVTVLNAAPGGGTTSPATFTIDNPAPALTSLAPFSAIAGGPGFTMALNGTDFVKGSVVDWNGAPLVTTYVSATEITAAVPAADIAAAGTASVEVFNAAPAGGTTPAVTFTTNNPPPTLVSIGPTFASPGGATFALTVTGTNFVSTSVIEWNGATLLTAHVSATELTATVPSAEIASPGSSTVTVYSPLPGGGASTPITFPILNPVPVLSSLAPSFVTANGPAFTLTATGSNFVWDSAIQWNGVSLATTYVSPTQLTAAVPAADISAPGTVSIAVFSPTPIGGTSSAAAYSVNQPLPALASLSATSAIAGGPAFTLAATGANFDAATVVQWNGAALVTTLVSPTEVTAAVPASAIAAVGNQLVTVANPGPGGGTSVAIAMQVVSFNTMSPTPPQSVPSGGAATFMISAVAAGGTFPSSVTFTVSGLPPAAMATFNPPSVAPGSSTMMTVATTAQTFTTGAHPLAAAGGPDSAHRFGPSPRPFASGSALTALLAGLSLVVGGRRLRIRIGPIVALLLLAMTAGVMTACGGGLPRAPISSGTPPGTYSLVVTGTTGTDSQSTTVMLTVQ